MSSKHSLLAKEQTVRVAIPPDNSRTVRCFLADGREVRGFYWRVEQLWYAEHGSRRKKDAIDVVDWREIGSLAHDAKGDG